MLIIITVIMSKTERSIRESWANPKQMLTFQTGL
jgi:hypothetical protein